MSEKDTNPFPKLDILPHPLRRIGHALLELGKLHQLASHGDHFQNTGGAPMLDRLMTEDISGAGIPIETQLMLDYYTLED